MDYYQSSRPPADDSGLSGGVSFNFNGQVAVQRAAIGSGGGSGGSGSSSKSSKPTIVQLTICVNGVPKTLNVYAAGEPT